MTINKTSSTHNPGNFNRPGFEQDADAYKSKGKLAEPAVCGQCGAVYHEGRWQWINAPTDADHVTCPACHRMNDNAPAGYVTLKGLFFDSHSEEIRRLIQHHAEHERSEHPLKRIIALENQAGALLVTTTDTHLARGIGEAIHHAYQGELKVEHTPGENLVRVYWTR
ncbi:MAG: BCAM0308 family protein [Methylotenera sp.]|nr:BCAM0308 family protein [Methylotenera sp.]HPH07875.1 BCAM0308 family protein [Methylotenera sp.]HPM50458.1 BCAM0308 family protein [Methylotenera sp.]